MHMANSHKAGIMDLFSNHAKRPHNGLPRRINVRGFTQEKERCLESRCQALRR